jgi:hypothetical protein
MEYELYHDESKVSGYWHGMLLVPIPKKQLLLDFLEDARFNTRYPNPISLKQIRGTGAMYECADAWINIGVSAMMSFTREKYPQYIYLGKRTRRQKEYSLFKDAIGAKLIIFRERDSLQKMNYVTEYGCRVETTLRIGLKGGIHFLGNDVETIHIEKMHFDGHEHYRRKLDRHRIVDRIDGLREYCYFSPRADLIDDRHCKHNRRNCQAYEDCQILQLTDLLISSFRSILTSTTNVNHIHLVFPVGQVIQRHMQGYARMKKSRWFNSLWMSQSYLENGKWNFEPIEIERDEKNYQLPLML